MTAPGGHATAAAKRQLVYVDMGEHKVVLEAFCAAREITVSHFVRTTILTAMADGAAAAGRVGRNRDTPGVATSDKPMKRCEVLLSPREITAVNERATRGGYTFRGYLVALVRGHLAGIAQFGDDELLALRESSDRLVEAMQLLRRAPGAEPAAFVHAIRSQLDEVRLVIERNEARWVR